MLMQIESLLHYLGQCISERTLFDSVALGNISTPDIVLGRNGSLIRGDFTRIVFEWFLSSLQDPACEPSYIEHRFRLQKVLSEEFKGASEGEIREVSKLLARIISDQAMVGQRTLTLNLERREELLERCRKRCSICGYEFTYEQVVAFQSAFEAPGDKPLPLVIDLYKPAGLKPQDFRIEVDHVYPYSRGGSSDVANLQLACGFCNVSKSNHLSVFDVSYSRARAFIHPGSGAKLSLPARAYIVRTLQGSRCGFCRVSSKEQELTTFLIRPKGEANPLNLGVTCYNCDPRSECRFVAREVLEKVPAGVIPQ